MKRGKGGTLEITVGQVVRRGLAMRCPRCGEGRVFCGRDSHDVFARCGSCSLRLERREGDLWFFYYISSAVITGCFLVVAILLFWRGVMVYPGDPVSWTILASSLLLTLLVTLRRRKALAIALDYLVDERLARPPGSGQQ